MVPRGFEAVTTFKIRVPRRPGLTEKKSTGSTPSNDDSGDRQQQTQVETQHPASEETQLPYEEETQQPAIGGETQQPASEETQQPSHDGETQQPAIGGETQQPNETQQPYEETQQAEHPCEETQQEETQVEPNETQQPGAIDLEVDTQSYLNMLRWGPDYDAIEQHQQVYNRH